MPVGPFQALNSEEIEAEVGEMWRTMYKLSKVFVDQPGPRHIANSVKSKVDKFKSNMPILATICNPGIRKRHWEQVLIVRLRCLCTLCVILIKCISCTLCRNNLNICGLELKLNFKIFFSMKQKWGKNDKIKKKS